MIKLQIIGYLGRDAVQREAAGKTVLSFSVAHTERFKSQQGVPQERTTWVDCALWDRANMAPYLTQGTQVYVEGTPVADAYKNNAGEATGQLRLRVYNMQLLNGRRHDDHSKAATAGILEDDALQEHPADDLPF